VETKAVEEVSQVLDPQKQAPPTGELHRPAGELPFPPPAGAQRWNAMWVSASCTNSCWAAGLSEARKKGG